MNKALTEPIELNGNVLTKKGKEILTFLLDNMKEFDSPNGVQIQSLLFKTLTHFDIDFGSKMESKVIEIAKLAHKFYINNEFLPKHKKLVTLRGTERLKYLDKIKIYIINTYKGKDISLVELEEQLKEKFPDITKARLKTAMSNLVLKGHAGVFHTKRMMYRFFK